MEIEDDPPLRMFKARVLVLLDEPETKTEHGTLFLPERAHDQRAHRTGRVVAVGPDVLDVKVGDRVLYQTTWQGCEADYQGKPYRVFDEEDIAAIVSPDAYVEMQAL